jgi:hypothetical protein
MSVILVVHNWWNHHLKALPAIFLSYLPNLRRSLRTACRSILSAYITLPSNLGI